MLTPPPSLKETCHDVDVPPGLDALVARALSKEARDRYPDAAAMLVAIDTTPIPRPRSGELPLDPRRTVQARPRSGATGSSDAREETRGNPRRIERHEPQAVPLARRAKSARMRAEVAARIAEASEDHAHRLRQFARSIR